MTTYYIPKAIFDNVEYLKNLQPPLHVPTEFHEDYQHAAQFLLSYQYNDQTYKSFRRDTERFVQWAWFVKGKSIKLLQRVDIEDYLLFCQKPPVAWVGIKNVARFIDQNAERKSNPDWRPFVATVPKNISKEQASDHESKSKSVKLKATQYHLSEKGFREIFTILNCLYNFLVQEAFTEINPILQIRQKNRFFRKQQGLPKIRRISELQWQYVIETAEIMAARDARHERTLFIISILYGLYLRISELVASARWSPKMNDFAKDHEGNWWFTTVGKGNKQRRIAVSNAMLTALKRWRKHLELASALPSPNDNTPLIPKLSGHGAITDTRHIRRIVQACFDETIVRMRADHFEEDADMLSQATVHWLRHTGISDDVKIRPREHVRDDAGHSSGAITDRYIDIDLRERHASAKKKLINKETMPEETK